MTLLPKYREPRICIHCNSKKTVSRYEGHKFMWFRRPILMLLGKEYRELGWYCQKCDWARAVTSKDPLFWVNCGNCGERFVSKKLDLCPRCDA